MSETAREAPGTPDRRNASLVTLVRGLSILDALAAAPPERGRSHASLARELGFQRSTLYRYLSCLQEHGYVEFADATGRFRLGPRAVTIGSAAIASRAFPRFAKQFVDELAHATGETAHATIFDGFQSVTIAMADGAGPIGPRIQIGSRRLPHFSASGKTFLAHQSPDVVDAYMSGELERRTKATIVDADSLRVHLEEVRRVGYATDQAEFVEGICCVAAPVFDFKSTPVGALSISVATEHLDPTRLASLTRPLIAIARTFSHKLGHAEPAEAPTG